MHVAAKILCEFFSSQYYFQTRAALLVNQTTGTRTGINLQNGANCHPPPLT